MAKPETKLPPKPKEEVLTEATSIADVKAKLKAIKDGELVRLPVSQLVFRLTKPSISKLLRSDSIPSELIATAMELDAEKYEPQSREDYIKSLDVINEVVRRAAVSPSIKMKADEVDENSIFIEDLDDQDILAIFLYAQTGVKPLSKFREEQPDGDAGSDLQTISGPKA